VLILLPDSGERHAIKGALESDGLRVNDVHTLSDARRVLNDGGIDLVITSQGLTDGGGRDLVGEVRRRDDYRFLPFILILDNYDTKLVEELTSAGVDEFLLRPVKREDVLLRSRLLVKSGIERRALVDALEEARFAASTEGELAERARRFVEEILASISSLVLVINEERRVRFMNQRAREFLGVAEDALPPYLGELLGKEFFAQPEVNRVLDIALRNGESARLDSLEVKGADGRSIICDMQVAPVKMGDTPHLAIALDDVTQRWEAEQELLIEKMKLDDVVNAMGASLSLVDKQGKILWHNRTFVEWFGEPKDRLCWQAFRQQRQQCSGCVMDEVLQGAAPACEEWRVFGPQGRFHAFQNHITPIRSPGGGIETALILTQDVTQQVIRIEQLDLLRKLGIAIETNLELDRLLFMVLSMVTAGHALGFNRAFLFLVDPDERTLRGRMALGPTSREEAFRIWAELAGRTQNLQDFLKLVDRPVSPKEIPLSNLILGLAYDVYVDTNILVDVVSKSEIFHVKDAWQDSRITEDFRRRFQAKEFIAVPLTSKGRGIGVLLTDNLYNERPITPEDINLLKTFSQQAAQGIANAISFERLHETIDELNATRQQLLESERLAAIGKTAAFVAHEIRNPLATIGGWANSILRKPDRRDRAEEAAKVILSETTRLERMLKGVMDFARPNQPVLTIEELNPIVENTLRKLAATFEGTKIAVRKELAPGLPRLKVDASQLEQVLVNIIKNATEAIGDRPGSIFVRTWKDGEEFAAIGVKDDGGGIAPEILDKLFDPFYTTKHRGSGLGLAVSRGIIASHGGRLDVLNTPGVGVDMIIRLPVGKPVG
jgi:hypothetical protein